MAAPSPGTRRRLVKSQTYSPKSLKKPNPKFRSSTDLSRQNESGDKIPFSIPPINTVVQKPSPRSSPTLQTLHCDSPGRSPTKPKSPRLDDKTHPQSKDDTKKTEKGLSKEEKTTQSPFTPRNFLPHRASVLMQRRGTLLSRCSYFCAICSLIL